MSRRDPDRDEPVGLFRDLPGAPQHPAAADRPVYRLMIRAEPGVNAIRALRWALKSMLRQHGLRCLSVDEVKPVKR